jgi:hypothetical protein
LLISEKSFKGITLKPKESPSSRVTRLQTVEKEDEDAMWWFRNGFPGYILGFEKSMGRYLQYNVSVLCGYNI